MSRQRLLTVVCYRLDPPLGMERVLASMLSQLVEQRDVDVVVLRHGVPPALADALSGANRVLLVRSNPARLVQYLWRRPRSATALVVGLWAALGWPPLWRRGRRKTIVWDHSLLPARFAHDARLARLRPLIRRLYSHASHVVAVSEASAACIRDELAGQRLAPQVSVIPNAVSAERIRPLRSAPREGVRLVCVGQLSAVKNTALAVEAMAHLPASWSLTCLGDGPERPSLVRRVAELDLAERVVLRGFVSDVRSDLAAADALVHPSLAETFCVVAFEAAREGVPIACLQQGALADFVPRYVVGSSSPPGASPSEFAATVRDAVALRDDEAAFDRAAAARAEDLSTDRVQRAWAVLFGRFEDHR